MKESNYKRFNDQASPLSKACRGAHGTLANCILALMGEQSVGVVLVVLHLILENSVHPVGSAPFESVVQVQYVSILSTGVILYPAV